MFEFWPIVNLLASWKTTKVHADNKLHKFYHKQEFQHYGSSAKLCNMSLLRFFECSFFNN